MIDPINDNEVPVKLQEAVRPENNRDGRFFCPICNAPYLPDPDATPLVADCNGKPMDDAWVSWAILTVLALIGLALAWKAVPA